MNFSEVLLLNAISGTVINLEALIQQEKLSGKKFLLRITFCALLWRYLQALVCNFLAYLTPDSIPIENESYL